MKPSNGISTLSTLRKFLSVGLMIFALGFLTVSNAFLYPDKDGLIGTILIGDAEESPLSTQDTPNANNMAEERAESGVNSLSEYIHDQAELAHPSSGDKLRHEKCHYIGDCLTVHFELTTPPPELA